MKIAVTGSLGHISKPLTEELIQKGHSVTVISSNPEKQKDITALGAAPAIGSIEDTGFLTTAFTGADAIYCMVPPVNFFNPDLDIIVYYDKLANSYAQAIRQSGVKQVVYLSSIGAHMNKGNGILVFHYTAENTLNSLPADVAITFMRPVGFYYNLYGFIDTIKTQGAIITNYNATYKEPWVSPIDIAAAVAEEITKPFTGRKIRYVASDELTSDEIASVLGAAIGKPDLKWIAIPHSGWLLLLHPDFLWNTFLAKKIKQYEYFDYSVNEALFLSEKEEAIMIGIMQNIQQEYHSNIDKFSQDVIIAQIDLFFTYAERFYHRQFITRKIANHKILNRLEDLLTKYFDSDALLKKGLPTVQYIAGELNVSPNYLSGLLKVLTGQSTQQHIHGKLIEKAKEKLSTTNLSVSEIAYELGFEHPQSFSKLFKSKTSFSPLEFRQSFN